MLLFHFHQKDELECRKEEVDEEKETEDENNKIVAKVEDGELDMTGIDDEEIDKVTLLTIMSL